MDFTTLLIVMAGGAFGSAARYVLSVLALPISQTLPWGTILINIAGSFLIGFFGTLTLAHGRFPLSESWRIFVMVGICGGFTTFSSFSLQSLDLLRGGAIVRASANIVLSVVLCIVAVSVGHLLAASFNRNQVAIAQSSPDRGRGLSMIRAIELAFCIVTPACLLDRRGRVAPFIMVGLMVLLAGAWLALVSAPYVDDGWLAGTTTQ